MTEAHAKDLAVMVRKAKEYAALKKWSAGQLAVNIEKLERMSRIDLLMFAPSFLRRVRCLKSIGREECDG